MSVVSCNATSSETAPKQRRSSLSAPRCRVRAENPESAPKCRVRAEVSSPRQSAESKLRVRAEVPSPRRSSGSSPKFRNRAEVPSPRRSSESVPKIRVSTEVPASGVAADVGDMYGGILLASIRGKSINE